MKKICRKKLFLKLKNLKGFWFHIVGFACLFWFLVRVVPAPHRSQYPCQQIAIPIALAYIAFWTALLHGLGIWLRKARFRTSAVLPSIIVVLIMVGSISAMVFAEINFGNEDNFEPWTPIPNQPIGTPRGANAGRVVWVWNPDATESDLIGYWWEEANNNQDIINSMFSEGIQKLAGANSDYEAWDIFFRYFNEYNERGEFGYQPGEKIAIKVNLNNCWDYYNHPYTSQDNERDANPYLVKTLLNQLIDIVGVNQEDITIFDASRAMANWFFYRVYYEKYPAIFPKPEFPNVNYFDAEGGAYDRQKVQPSSEKIYFADGTGLYRTLPTCVVDADYIINMPILKRHPLNGGHGVTLSAKNFFGTFIEPVVKIHKYHESGHILGNPTPQTDLLAHEQIGKKTLIYIGDGLYPTLIDHKTIGKFQMYPFNNDWTNSLFFSQDPVAIDSVMYDFLHTEGTNPSEGSQNYLHQSAEPLKNTYDPENDGVFLSESLGVHEHWNTSIDIFSEDRYSGPEGNGIDFIACGEEYAHPASPQLVITNPKMNFLYLNGVETIPLPFSVIIGEIEVKSNVIGTDELINKVEFYCDGNLEYLDQEAPYVWPWNKLSFSKHQITIIASMSDGTSLSNGFVAWKIF
jgi:hypothetical protein